MKRTIALHYYWPGLNADIEHHCDHCRRCKLRKATTTGTPIPRIRHIISLEPFTQLHIDLVTDLPKTKEGFQHILVMKCASSHWVEIVPLRHKSAHEIATLFLDNIVYRHGCPKILVSDRGSEFLNRLLKTINQLMLISHRPTSAYNPQSNGKVENFNRSLKDMIHMFAAQHQLNWPTVLPMLAHSYRTTVNSTTGYSPFFILHGREARQPSELWIQSFIKPGTTLDQWIANLSRCLLSTWNLAATHTLEAHDRQDRKVPTTLPTTDAPITPAPDQTQRRLPYHPFKPGDEFYLRTIPLRFHRDDSDHVKYKLTLKLQSRYTGPHHVIRVVNPVIFLCNVDGRYCRIHISRMKRGATHNSNIRRHLVADSDTTTDSSPTSSTDPSSRPSAYSDILPPPPIPTTINQPSSAPSTISDVTIDHSTPLAMLTLYYDPADPYQDHPYPLDSFYHL